MALVVPPRHRPRRHRSRTRRPRRFGHQRPTPAQPRLPEPHRPLRCTQRALITGTGRAKNPATEDGLVNHYLAKLTWLNNRDKHRLLHLGWVGSSFRVEPDQQFELIEGMPQGELLEGTPVGRYRWRGADPPTARERRIIFGWDLALDLAIGGGGPVDGGLVHEVLWQCAKATIKAVDYITGTPRGIPMPDLPRRRMS